MNWLQLLKCKLGSHDYQWFDTAVIYVEVGCDDTGWDHKPPLELKCRACDKPIKTAINKANGIK